jgi:hypothetical protein
MYSKLRGKLFQRTFLSFKAPLLAFWPARRADFLSIVAPEQPYFAGKTPFARLRPPREVAMVPGIPRRLNEPLRKHVGGPVRPRVFAMADKPRERRVRDFCEFT